MLFVRVLLVPTWLVFGDIRDSADLIQTTASATVSSPDGGALITPDSDPHPQQISDYGLSASLWLGEADGDDTEFFNGTGLAALRRHEETQSGKAEVLGMYHTGTNLLSKLLALNIPKMPLVGGSVTPTAQGCSVWKHASLRHLKTHMPAFFSACGDTLGVPMVRNPLAFLASFKTQNDYDINGCKAGADWLTRTCSVPSYLSQVWASSYASVPKMWNQFTSDYVNVAGFFGKGTYVRYEDLVMDTEHAIQKIMQSAGMEASGNMTVKQVARGVNPQPTAGGGNQREKAIKQITSKSYLSVLSKDEVREACSQLDKGLMKRLEYHDCD